jgi:hypothetical protein
VQLQTKINIDYFISTILKYYLSVFFADKSHLQGKLLYDICVLQIDIYKAIDIEKAVNELGAKQE